MPLLNSKSSRFTRSFDHMLPRNKPVRQDRKTELSMVAPATHHRTPEQRKGSADSRS